MKTKVIWRLRKKTFQEWSNDNGHQLAAAIAFYTIFSIPPLLIISLSIAGYFFDTATTQNQLIAQVSGIMGSGTGDFVQSLLQDPAQPTERPIYSIISIVVLLIGASGVFYQIQIALNKIWNVPLKTEHRFRHILINRFQSFLMVLGVGFLLLLFLGISAVLSLLFNRSDNSAPIMFLPELINILVLFCLVTMLIAMIFRLLPDKRIAWSDVWLGAAVTSLFFMLGRYAIGFFLSISKPSSAFGAAGSLIILLLWVYYSAQIFLLGAEFTHLYSVKFGSQRKQDARKSIETKETLARSK